MNARPPNSHVALSFHPLRQLAVTVLPLLIAGITAMATAQAQTTHYVAEDGIDQPPCTHPEQPCQSIGFAFSHADPGDIINIGPGTFRPTAQQTSLVIDKDITLQGAGSNQTWVQREWTDPAHRIIEISGSPGNHQVTIADLRIRFGMALGSLNEGRGGGIYNADSYGHLTLSNVNLNYNLAQTGGGLYNTWNGSVTLSNVLFQGNSAESTGGAIYSGVDSYLQANHSYFVQNSSDSSGGAIAWQNAHPESQLSNLFFNNNSADHDGGAIWLAQSSPGLNQIKFSGNQAGDSGGAVFLYNSSPSIIGAEITDNQAGFKGGGIAATAGSAYLHDVTFDGNVALVGGGMHNDAGSSPSLLNTDFMDNLAHAQGGGMRNIDESNPTLEKVRFLSNATQFASGAGGGGMQNIGSSPSLKNVEFRENTSASKGGGMLNEQNSSPILANVEFHSNEALSTADFDGGGGIYNLDSSPEMTNIKLIGNQASLFGGGMMNSSSSFTLVNALVTGNQASHGAGISINSNSSAAITNATISLNQATGFAGGIYNTFNANATLYNVIIWSNSAGTGNDISNSSSSALTVHYSIYSNHPDDLDNEGILTCIECLVNADPGFVEPHGGNFLLKADSAAVDAGWPGTNSALFITDSKGNPVDLNGRLRFYGNSIDMGPFEWQILPDVIFHDSFEGDP